LNRALRLYCNVLLLQCVHRHQHGAQSPSPGHTFSASASLTLRSQPQQRVRNLTYTITAKRDTETMTSQRSSVLIALAKAKVWDSEGWDVLISKDDGAIYPPADFARLESADAPQSRQRAKPDLTPDPNALRAFGPPSPRKPDEGGAASLYRLGSKPQNIDRVAGHGGGEIGDVAVVGEDDDLPRAAGSGQ
jgi:hypothetical protein